MFLVSIIVLFYTAGCGNTTNTDSQTQSEIIESENAMTTDNRTQSQIIENGNQQISFDELISIEFDQDDLQRKFKSGTTLVDINDKLSIECLRVIDEKSAYAIFKSKEGGLLILSFENREGNYCVINHWYIEKLLFKQDFESLNIGDRYSDVVSVDRYGNNASFGASAITVPPFSIHQTLDGYVVRIDYEVARGYDNFSIIGINYTEATKSFIYPNLLSMDKEGFKAYLNNSR